MKYINSDVFGKVQQPASFNELIKIITTCSISSNSTRMWRGQGNIEWPIHSSAFRRIKPSSEKDMIRYEERLLEQATHKGYRFHNGIELSDMDLLARLQHHGAATRLVDTSRNALVALWFCCSDEINKTGTLIGVHSHHLGGYEGESETELYSEVMKDLNEISHPVTWEPPALSNRVTSQNSQFLYSDMSNDKWGSLKLPRDEGVTLILAINPFLKKECLKTLQETFDIRQLTLFPDLDGFCKSNDQFKHEFFTNRW